MPPLAARAALAVLETVEEEHLLANAHAMGEYLVHRLNEPGLRAKIADIRAIGLMIGVELNRPVAKQVQRDALERGLILNAIGENVLRLLPPLIITQADIDRAMEILKAVL